MQELKLKSRWKCKGRNSAKDEHPSMSPEVALGTHLNMVQGTSSDQKETQSIQSCDKV